MKNGLPLTRRLSLPRNRKFLVEVLPKLSDGRTYVTAEMMDDNNVLRKLVERTRAAWYYDVDMQIYVTGALDMRIPPTRSGPDDTETTGPVEETSD